jgi:hypothetical protein
MTQVLDGIKKGSQGPPFIAARAPSVPKASFTTWSVAPPKKDGNPHGGNTEEPLCGRPTQQIEQASMFRTKK